MNGINELAEIIGQVSAADPAVRDKLKLHVADTVCAWIAATTTPEGKALIAFRNRLRGPSQSGASGLPEDLATHCALARLSEIDDIHLKSMTTPGSVVVAAAITLASAWPEAAMDDITAAMLAGYEAMIRLGLAIKGPTVLYRGIWPTYFASGFATAAVVARLLRLDRAQTAQALALALTTAAPSVGQHHGATTARWFSVGNAARNGLTAALAAQSGFTADVDILQSRLFPEVFGIEPDISAMIGDRTPAFLDLSLKPWCAARQTMPATQALREILAASITADSITGITAAVLPPHLKMIDHGVKAGDRASYLTSLPYQMAIAALQPEQLADLNQTDGIPPASLQAFMARVKVVADDGLLADYPATWPAHVVVTTSQARHERRVDHIPGDPARAFTEVELARKFEHFVAPAAGAESAALLRSALAALDSRDALNALKQKLDRVMLV